MDYMLIEEIETLSKIDTSTLKKSVLELFEEDLYRYEEVIAVTDNQRKITYGELNKRANGLAQHLMERGVIQIHL